MTSEKLNRAMELDNKREYYEGKLNDIARMRSLVDESNREGRYGEPIIGVSIGGSPYVTAHLHKSIVVAMLKEADKFYMAKKLEAVDEFAKL